MTIDLIPSLAEAVQNSNLDPGKLMVALARDPQKKLCVANRHSIFVTDGEKAASWEVPQLMALCRGDRKPPADITHFPPEYVPCFFFVENQFLTLCTGMGDRTDQEMEEVYSALRRRPDGRSLGLVHDFLWQVSALLLGTYPLSAAEFEGIMDALLGSARKWSLRPVSRFYASFLRENI